MQEISFPIRSIHKNIHQELMCTQNQFNVIENKPFALSQSADPIIKFRADLQQFRGYLIIIKIIPTTTAFFRLSMAAA